MSGQLQVSIFLSTVEVTFYYPLPQPLASSSPPTHTHTHTQYLGELKDIPTSVDMSKRGYLLSQLDTQRV